MRNKIMTLFIGGLVVLAVIWAFRPAAVPVDLISLTRGPMEVFISGDGQTRIHDVYTVSAPVAGRIHRIGVHAGDQVIAGETLLATIEPSSPQFLDARAQAQAKAAAKAAEAAKSLALAELNRARAEAAFAQSNLTRAQNLIAKQTISEVEFDQAKLEAATRRAAVASAEATLRVRAFELETAKAALIEPNGAGHDRTTCCVEVLAPVNGRVLRVLRQSEGVIEQASAIIELGDPNRLEVVVDLLSSQALRAREGASAVLKGWGGEKELLGQVRRVEPSGFTKISALGIEEQRVNVIIDFTGPAENRQGLGHGFRIEAFIREWREENVLQVPVGALFRDRDRWAVFVYDDGKAKLTRIDVGRRNGRTAQVLSGLDGGERVVSHPSDQVTDGGRIEARQTE